MKLKNEPSSVLSFDRLVSTIAAFGVPGLMLTIAMGASGYVGAAAITSALAALGPGGMIGGICFLGIIGFLSQGVAKYSFHAIFASVVKELYKRGETKESILAKIDGYKISKSLKLQLKHELDMLA